MEFSIEKCAMLIMRSRTNKYFGLEADAIKHIEMKPNYIAEISSKG